MARRSIQRDKRPSIHPVTEVTVLPRVGSSTPRQVRSRRLGRQVFPAVLEGTSAVRQDGNNSIIGGRQPRLFEFTAAGGWRSLPDIPIDGQAATIVWVDGAGLLAWNYDLESALLDATGSWRRLGNVPMPFCECYPRSVATAGGAAAGGFYVAWFEAATERWHPIRLPADARFAVTSTAIVAFADQDDDGTRMVALPLPPPSR
jgi:hypothetical protein